MRYAFLDEEAKKEIRRSILKAIAIPGYIVSFASREMPVGAIVTGKQIGRAHV